MFLKWESFFYGMVPLVWSSPWGQFCPDKCPQFQVGVFDGITYLIRVIEIHYQWLLAKWHPITDSLIPSTWKVLSQRENSLVSLDGCSFRPLEMRNCRWGKSSLSSSSSSCFTQIPSLSHDSHQFPSHLYPIIPISSQYSGVYFFNRLSKYLSGTIFTR